MLFLCIDTAFSQQPPPPPPSQQSFSDRIYVGGNFGLQFGTYYTLVDIAPLAGYKFTEKFSSGLGATYIYYKYKDPTYNFSFHTNVYGGSVFSRYFISDYIFAHAELEELSLETFDYFDQKVQRIWVPALFIGGGYQQPIGGHGFAQFLILYDVIQDLNSPYNNPVIRIGFGFGF
jgi:hypothetical protein